MSAGGKWENTERQTEKRYFVEHRLGNGGMAEVYRTKDTGLDVHVAMKVLKDEYTYQPFVRERFIKEGRLLFRLNHPSVVRVFDLIELVVLLFQQVHSLYQINQFISFVKEP